MTENEAKRFMMIEKECINRDCNRDCVKCDIVQTVDNLNNAYDMAIKALEEIQQYRAIGTPEECRAAVEQQIPKRPTLCKSDEQTTRYTADYRCPKCNGMFTGTGIANYCYHCGQRLDWEELT
jgi:hypothetical protein